MFFFFSQVWFWLQSWLFVIDQFPKSKFFVCVHFQELFLWLPVCSWLCHTLSAPCATGIEQKTRPANVGHWVACCSKTSFCDLYTSLLPEVQVTQQTQTRIRWQMCCQLCCNDMPQVVLYVLGEPWSRTPIVHVDCRPHGAEKEMKNKPLYKAMLCVALIAKQL